MVQNWKKQLEKIILSSDVDFRKVFLDILNRNYINYDKILENSIYIDIEPKNSQRKWHFLEY